MSVEEEVISLEKTDSIKKSSSAILTLIQGVELNIRMSNFGMKSSKIFEIKQICFVQKTTTKRFHSFYIKMALLKN